MSKWLRFVSGILATVLVLVVLGMDSGASAARRLPPGEVRAVSVDGIKSLYVPATAGYNLTGDRQLWAIPHGFSTYRANIAAGYPVVSLPDGALSIAVGHVILPEDFGGAVSVNVITENEEELGTSEVLVKTAWASLTGPTGGSSSPAMLTDFVYKWQRQETGPTTRIAALPLAPGYSLSLEVMRDATGAADTIAGPVHVLGFVVKYTTADSVAAVSVEVANGNKTLWIPADVGLNKTTGGEIQATTYGESRWWSGTAQGRSVVELPDNAWAVAMGDAVLPVDWGNGVSVRAVVESVDESGELFWTSKAAWFRLPARGWTATGGGDTTEPFSVAPLMVSVGSPEYDGLFAYADQLPGDVLTLEFGRDATDPADTIAGPVHVLGFVVEYELAP